MFVSPISLSLEHVASQRVPRERDKTLPMVIKGTSAIFFFFFFNKISWHIKRIIIKKNVKIVKNKLSLQKKVTFQEILQWNYQKKTTAEASLSFFSFFRRKSPIRKKKKSLPHDSFIPSFLNDQFLRRRGYLESGELAKTGHGCCIER